jgi:hypothetical protein
MTLNIATIVSSFAALNISGVKICDTDHIPASVPPTACPILYPEPLGFVTDFTVVRDSWGAPSVAKKTATYTLHYTFCYMPVGAARELERYGDMVETAFAILDAVILNEDLAGALEFDPAGAMEFGPVPDPAGNLFLGCRFAFLVTEFIN